jgi:MinD-like ATPase involved in chromosome partitioning or flagellar assembly
MCLIKGKANITNKVLVTPRGVATTVTDEQLAQLKRCKMFMTHLENGFLFIDEKAKSATADKADEVAKNMQAKDKSAPPKKEDIKNSLNKNVKIVTDNDKSND